MASRDTGVHFETPEEEPMKTIYQGLLSLRDKMVEARRQKGSWEGWLQVELAIYLRRTIAIQYYIFREEHIYPTASQKIDVWCEPVRNTLPRYGIELKVEAEYQTTSLLSRFQEDFAKAKGGPMAKYKQAPGTSLFVVGITSNKVDLNAYEKVAASAGQTVQAVPIPSNDPNDPHDFYMVWWGKHFQV